MNLIMCPECNFNISKKAIFCPHCGYVKSNMSKSLPTANTNNEIIPIFKYEIEDIGFEDDVYQIISFDDNKNIIEELGSWDKLQKDAPAIAEVITEMAKEEKELVVKMDDYIKKLIKKGVYRFSIDSNGEILPTIRNAKGIVKQVRLENKMINSQAKNSFHNLVLQAAMSKIIDEIKNLNESIEELHTELQNDRIAVAESAIDKMEQALQIKRKDLRETSILNAISTATDAKRTLMRNFLQTLDNALNDYKKNNFEIFKEKKSAKESSNMANEAFQSLVIITNMLQLEFKGYSMLGEVDAANEVLVQFKKFIDKNKLGDKNTLLKLNGVTKEKREKITYDFVEISNKIEALNNRMIEINNNNLLEETDENIW